MIFHSFPNSPLNSLTSSQEVKANKDLPLIGVDLALIHYSTETSTSGRLVFEPPDDLYPA
jgi:hypothetical protein